MSRPLSTLLAPSQLHAASLEEATAACLRLCRAHYENFPVASLWVPRDKRGAIAAVYAFARVADDFADEPFWEVPERLRLLTDWRERLRAAAQGDHRKHPLFWALSDAMARFRLPLDPFERLLTAFEMDVTVSRYGAFDQLLFYCDHSANPVGELVLRVFDAYDDKRKKWSDALCTALQLANFWQDVTVDAQKNRIYVPTAVAERFGVTEEDILKGPASERSRALIQDLAGRTWALFRDGRPLCDAVPRVLRTELRFVWLGGTRILEKIAARKHDVWSRRPVLSAADWLRLLPRGLFWRRTPPSVR